MNAAESSEFAGPAQDFLAGGGDMGALTRALDWDRTSVGPIENWPQSLRTAVSILLSSRYPMFLFWGPDAVCFYNDGYRPSLGAHKHPQALGQLGRECWVDIWHIIGPQIEGVMKRGEVTWHEDQLVPFDRNGYLEEIYFTYSYSPVRDESSGVGGTLVVCTETTERVIGERRLRTLRNLSARSAGLRHPAAVVAHVGRTLMENAADVPFVFVYQVNEADAVARLVFAGGAFENDATCPPATTWSEKPTQGFAWPFYQVLTSGRTEVVEQNGGFPGSLPGAAWPERPCQAVVMPLVLSGRQRADFILVAGVNPRKRVDAQYRTFYDLAASQIAASISDAYAFEDERRRAEALAELDRAKTEFFSNVSHEFRTPLTLLLAPMQDTLATARERLTPEERTNLQVAERNAVRLLKLVNTLLDFSRIEAGRAQARYEATDLARYTEELSSVFRSAIERAGLHFNVDCQRFAEPVYVDREMWEKVVLNLLSNAFKYTLRGSISVSLRMNRGLAVLAVSDTGIGVPQEHISRLFDRFHRVEGARGRTQEGSGNGLSLVREIVRLHGGTVAVESQEGSGSTFTVRIPFGSTHLPADRINAVEDRASTAVPPEAFVYDAGSASEEFLLQAGLSDIAPDAPLPAHDREPDAFRQKRARVLLAEDNADLREYVRRLLSAEYDVITARDGKEALALALADPPDIVLSDIMMPQFDGTQLLRELRSHDATRTMPIVLLFARAGQEASAAGLEAGADDYLAKPFTARELLARIHAHLTLKRERQHAQQRLAQVFREAPVAICVMRGRDLVFELANPLYQELLQRRTIIGRPIRDVIPELDPEILGILLNVFETGEPFVANEMLIPLDRDGTREDYWFNLLYHPLRERGDAVSGVIAVGTDVTQQVRARVQLEQVNRELEEFAYVASHDLREPLRTVNVHTELLLRKHIPPDNFEAVKCGEWIGQGVKRMEHLINDLLEYSRSAHASVMEQSADVARAVAGAVASLDAQIARTGAMVTCEAEACVRADQAHLVQLFQNLISNALKYRKDNEPPRIRIRSVREDDTCLISVSDDGIGFDQAYADGIFRLFKRLHGQKYPGTGVGLAICKRVVERFGGEIWATSAVGVGSTFYIRLRTAENSF